MGMFFNYINIDDNYTPNNLSCTFPKLKCSTKLNPIEKSKPYEEYNEKGELIGYYWHYGETINLDFSIEGEITIESDAILLTGNQSPSELTQGHIGQRAYNIVTFRSWTCTAIENKSYIWTEDAEFIYPSESDRDVYVSAKDYLQGKQVTLTIYDFRMEPLHTITVEASPQLIFSIDKELSTRLTKGVYYCSLIVFDNNSSFTVFNSTDCTLVVR